jgi:hypothetical protein
MLQKISFLIWFLICIYLIYFSLRMQLCCIATRFEYERSLDVIRNTLCPLILLHITTELYFSVGCITFSWEARKCLYFWFSYFFSLFIIYYLALLLWSVCCIITFIINLFDCFNIYVFLCLVVVVVIHSTQL